jgi:NADH-quinone oxidoreductase subunit C
MSDSSESAFDRIVAVVQETHGTAVKGIVRETSDPKKPHKLADPWLEVESGSLPAVLKTLRDDPRTRLNHLSLVTGVDYVKEKVMEVVYHLDSFTLNTPFVIKVKLNREDSRMPTSIDVHKTADWHEREVFDLSGVIFEGHPNLTRILCADDWAGHPLRKDYVWPEVYHGIPCGPFAKESKNIPAEWELEGFSTRNSG